MIVSPAAVQTFFGDQQLCSVMFKPGPLRKRKNTCKNARGDIRMRPNVVTNLVPLQK
jgi:hypothetical protein